MEYRSLRVRVIGPLEPFADGFRAELAERGHRRGRRSHLTLRGLSPLLSDLRGLGVVPDAPPHVTNSVLEELLSDYRGYLVRERGLVAGSVHGYESVARRFLSERARGGELDLEGLVAADVTRFVQGECRDGHVRGAKIVVSALRSLLHYLRLEGRTARQLAWVVPAVAFAPRRWPPWTSKTSIGERARWWCPAKDIARSDCRCPSMSARRLSTTSARVGPPAGARGCSYGSGLPITS